MSDDDDADDRTADGAADDNANDRLAQHTSVGVLA